MGNLDIFVFIGFIVVVLIIGLWQARGEKTHGEHGASEYFLAGRGLTWWLVGLSLIAANISTEQFVGMSGQAADWLGMAVATWEWLAAITLIVVAFLFLPTFLKLGIYTIPEFFGKRYGKLSSLIMAIATLVVLVGVPTVTVIFSGAKVISVAFAENDLLGLDLGNIVVGCWLIGIVAAFYVFFGGLKSCAWADLVLGTSLILGGVIIAYLAFDQLKSADPADLINTAANPDIVSAEKLQEAGSFKRFLMLNGGRSEDGGKLHMIRPADDPSLPWTIFLLGIWIPNFFYWGLNQYIMQRSLGSKSLAEGQKGIVFAGFLKLIIPFVVVIPGMLAFNLFNKDLRQEAIKKNSDIIQEFNAGSNKFYPFSAEFAEVNPKVAAAMLAHNTKITESASIEKKLSADDMGAKNAELSLLAGKRKVEMATQVVGYDYDAAFPTLMKNLLKQGSGLKGFVFAAIFGAVISSLASMLNAASTVFTMDIYNKIRARATQFELVSIGRLSVVIFMLAAASMAPRLADPKFKGIFHYVQEFQGFISSGILAACLFGLLVKRAPRYLGWLDIVLNVGLYWYFKYAVDWVFVNRMAVVFLIIIGVNIMLTLLNPLKKPIVFAESGKVDLRTTKSVRFWGATVCALTALLYIIFW